MHKSLIMWLLFYLGTELRSRVTSERSPAESNEQALVALKLKKPVDAEGGRTLAVIIEGG